MLPALEPPESLTHLWCCPCREGGPGSAGPAAAGWQSSVQIEMTPPHREFPGPRHDDLAYHWSHEAPIENVYQVKEPLGIALLPAIDCWPS